MSKKKEEQLAQAQKTAEAARQAAAPQSGYSTADLNSRSDVQNALAGAEYLPSQNVTDAANDIKQWQQKRPGQYQSAYQDKMDELMDALLGRDSFQYSYAQDPLYRQYAQLYTQNAANASADAAAQAAALTGGYGSSYAASVAQQAYQQQIGALSEAIPTLYRLALDTYTGGGEELVTKLDQLGAREQNDQNLYNHELADYYTRQGKRVMLAAGDTFRAAASEQLEIWASRAGVPIVSAGEGADPAAVIFDTVKSATARGYDMVIADTAGRLHNKSNLMAELSKISRSVKKASPEASLETLLVLDAITGQNAISQAKEFCKAADATGIILTKLDGTAKGGCVVAVKQRLGLPVRFIGVGEGIDDLLPFTPEGFVEELLPREWKH